MKRVDTSAAGTTRHEDDSGLAISALLGGDPPKPKEIDAFLAGRTVPIVEGTRCTFLYRGHAQKVRLRHWIYGLPTAEPFELIPGTDLWYHIVEVPERSRVEYKLEIQERRGVRLTQDPLNPLLARDPFGANSVLHAAGYEAPVWAVEDPGVPKGTLEERVFESHVLGTPRRLTLYRPPHFKEARRYHLLVVHDGGDYLRFASLATVLDNLIERMEIPGLIAALTHPPDRMADYRDHPEYARYLTEELVPALESELPLIGAPNGRALMGASLGAVASFGTAIRYPGFYGRLLLQSGSFAFSDIGSHDRGPIFDPIADMVNAYRASPTDVSERVFMSCGMYESLIYEHRSLAPLLQRTGMDVRYVEARDGHNWEAWRDHLRDGLAFLFPGPMWWVYA